MTNRTKQSLAALCTSGLLALGHSAMAYESGSTGADGAFSPQVDTTVQLPEDGVFNYTTVNIPTGVVVRFEKNATNTPVIILASGDVTIAGSLNVNGSNGKDTAAKGDGNLGDDGIPGGGGPGGFDGGAGGQGGAVRTGGGNGLGPGGGPLNLRTASAYGRADLGCPGLGGGYATAAGVIASCTQTGVSGGQPYGSSDLQPLIGGSGGSGGFGGDTFGAAGGGGGGGAVLIASSGVLTVSGSILANGGNGGDVSGAGSGGVGGSGSGGAIRLIATTLAGNGSISASPGVRQKNDDGGPTAGTGSVGRIKVEAENVTRTAVTSPAFVLSGPQEIFLANIPGVRITSVAGITAPASPTGAGDIVIPEATPNPVTIEFVTTNIPVGNTIELTVTPQSGVNITAISGAITGTDASGTASVSVEIPDGPSSMSASITFTVAIASLQQDYSQFAKGNKVEKIRIDFDPQQGSMTTFIAANGSEYTWPSNTVAIN